jgi:homoserine dehydrogenase
VVTANKHVIAHHGPALEAIARAKGAPLRFEAAVGGGIPVLGPLAGDLAANRVTRVRGIVNGTTNYILSAMAEGRGTYEAVLREAQEQGYAEADPSGDVNGGDAINKLVILARLAFDAWLDPALVPDRPFRLRGPGGPGITGVTSAELGAAAALGLTIRLVALAERSPAGGPPTATVVPTAVPLDSPLGRTSGVRNRVEIVAEPVGEIGFDGPGAGGPATSSAVLGDLLAVARGQGSTWAGRPAAEEIRTGPGGDDEQPRAWFALLPGVRAGKVLSEVAEAHHETDAGVAIRTAPIVAAELTARLLDAVPESLDATLYPIDA